MKQPKKLTRKQKEIISRRHKELNPDDYGLVEDFKDKFIIVKRGTKEIKEINY